MTSTSFRVRAASQGGSGSRRFTAQERANVDQAPHSDHMAAGVSQKSSAADWSEPIIWVAYTGAFVLGFALAWSF